MADKLLGLVQRKAKDLTPVREAELAHQAGVPFGPGELSAAFADGVEFISSDDVASRSRALGSNRGLELWHHLYVLNKGVGPGRRRGPWRTSSRRSA